jgi:hypothetical protein
MRMTLRTTWNRILAVARGEMTLEQAQRERLVEVLTRTGDYVGLTHAGWLLSMSTSTVNKYRSRTGFPPHVARVDGDPLWLRADIEAYRDHADAYRSGQREWEHDEGCLDHELIGSDQIEALTGLPREQVVNRVYEERWDRVRQTDRQGRTPALLATQRRRSLGARTGRRRNAYGPNCSLIPSGPGHLNIHNNRMRRARNTQAVSISNLYVAPAPSPGLDLLLESRSPL